MAIPSLNIGGGKWATKQDKLLAYKQNTGGRYFAIDGDTSRNSTATFTNQNGLIESVGNNVARVDFQDDVKGSLLLETQSTNLIIQSESFGNSYWTKSGASIQGDPSTAGVEEVVNGDFATDSDWLKGTGWSINGGVATHTGATGNLTQDIGIGNKTVLLTFNIVSISGGVCNVYDISNAVTLYSFTTVGLKTVTINQNGNYIGFRSNSTSVSIDNVSVKEVQGFASPSLDSPLGAFKLVESSSNEWQGVYKLSLPTGNYSLSLFSKSDLNDRYLTVRAYAGSNDFICTTFDIFTGVISQNFIGSSSTFSNVISDIKQLSNGYYRCILSFTNANTIVAYSYNLDNTSTPVFGSSGTSSYTGDGTSGVYIFGAQVEALPYATSYIPTSGSAVTRVQDVANSFGDVNTFNSEEGVLFVEMAALIDDLTSRDITISDGSNDNFIRLGYTFQSNKIRVTVISNTVLVYNSYIDVVDITEIKRIALKWSNGSNKTYVNGVELDSNTLTPTPLNLNNFSFTNAVSSGFFKGKVKQVQVYKEALTDAQLITLTTI